MRNSERESGMRRIERLVQSSEGPPTFRNGIEEEMLVTGGAGEPQVHGLRWTCLTEEEMVNQLQTED